MRAKTAGWAQTALVTSALIVAASAGRCAAAEPDRRPIGEPAAGIPAPRFEAAGLSSVRSHVRGKIPVVLIHGLGSSPRSWARMIDGLEADPILRETYQFWTFGYRTGDPILHSAAVLRRALLQARARYDPDGSDPAFDHMVLVGHSLGGLLAKLMVQDSRSRLWETISAQPPDRLDGPAEARACLRQAFLFKPLPGVRRVVFIATPHRGSRLDRGAIRALGTRLIRHGDPLLRAYASLLASNRPDFFRDTFREGLPTSVDQLTWDHPLLLALRDAGIDPAATYHSIIANLGDPPRAGGTDGVVPYASAHLDGAASELLIHGGHLCQDHPLVIRECRRILTERLVPIVPRPDGGPAGAPEADAGRRPAPRSEPARPPLRPPAPRVVRLAAGEAGEDRAGVGLGPLDVAGPPRGPEAVPPHQSPDVLPGSRDALVAEPGPGPAIALAVERRHGRDSAGG